MAKLVGTRGRLGETSPGVLRGEGVEEVGELEAVTLILCEHPIILFSA